MATKFIQESCVSLAALLFLQILCENPETDASRIWNCNESGFPTDHSKEKVVSVKVSLHHDKSLCLEDGCIRQKF